MEVNAEAEQKRKEQNRKRSAKYYQKHKEEIAQRSKEKYTRDPEISRRAALNSYYRKKQQLGIENKKPGRPRKYPEITPTEDENKEENLNNDND